MRMTSERLLSAAVVCMLCCGYAGVASARDGDFYTGTVTLPNGEVTDEYIRAVTSGTATTNDAVIRAASGTTSTWNNNVGDEFKHGVITAMNGGRMVFEAGSTVNVNKTTSPSRNIYLGRLNGNYGISTGDFSGTINITSEVKDSRGFHADQGSEVVFHAGAETNVTIKPYPSGGSNTYGFVVSKTAKVDNYGSINVVMAAGTEGVKINKDKDLGIATLNASNWVATGLIVGWNQSGVDTSNSSYLHIGTESGASNAGSLSVNSSGNLVTAAVLSGSTLQADEGTSVNFTNNYAGQTALFNGGSKVNLEGNTTITSVGGNAIYMQTNSGNDGKYETITNIGNAAGTSKVNITGDIYNYAQRDNDALNINLGTSDSFIKGNNYIDGFVYDDSSATRPFTEFRSGKLTNITLNNGAAWEGNSVIKKAVASDGADVVQNSKVNVALNQNSTWKGDTSNNGRDTTNNITLNDTAAWQGTSLNNTTSDVNGGQGGVTNITLNNQSTWEGQNNVTQGSTNTILNGDAVFTGDGFSSVMADNSDGVNKKSTLNWTITDRAKLNGDLAVEDSLLDNADNFATLNVHADKEAHWQGDLGQTNGMAQLFFNGESSWTGNNTSTGRNNVKLMDNSKWVGNEIINGGFAFVDLTTNATWNGNYTATSGENNVNLNNKTSWTGNGDFSGDANTVITSSGDSKINGNLILNATKADGSDSFYFGADENSQLNGNVTTNGGSGGTMEFGSTSSWNNGINTVNAGKLSVDLYGTTKLNNVQNVVNGGENNLLLEENAAWTGNNTVTGGTNTASFIGSSTWQGNNAVAGGTNTVSFKDNTTWRGDNAVTGGTNNVALADNTNWFGNSTTTAGANTLSLKNNAFWEGNAVDNGGKTTVDLQDSAKWYVTNKSTIDKLNSSEGTLVDMVENSAGTLQRKFYTLDIDTVEGTGTTFRLETDLDKAKTDVTTDGDKVHIANANNNGTYYVQVADESLYTGTEINGDRKLLIVTVDNGELNVNLVGKELDQGGLWQVNPPSLIHEDDDPTHWYLGYYKKEANDDTTTYLTDRQVAVYNQWARINNDSLRKRLGDLRYNKEDNGGVWARYYNGKLTGSGYSQRYYTFQAGIDKMNGNSAYGLAVEQQESTQSYTYGNGEGSTVAGSIYYTNYSDTGTYFDSILKYGKMNSKYDTTGNFPDHADYDTPAYSLSLEYGKTNRYDKDYFVEPKVQLTYSHIGSETYNTNRGTTVAEGSIKSLISKIGVTAGRQINKDSDYYLKAGWFKEWKGERDVTLAAANGEHMMRSYNYGDSWFEVGIGGNVRISRKTHLYGDIEKSFGGDTTRTFQVNAGVRWEF